MLRDNILALKHSLKFCNVNKKSVFITILLITIISYIQSTLGLFLLTVFIGSLAFFLRDRELVEELNLNSFFNFKEINHYIRYGLVFSLLLFFIILIIFLITLSIAVLLTFILYILSLYQNYSYSFPFYFILSLIISLIIVAILLFPFYLMLPSYMNLILSSSYPFEILKVNRKILTKKFWINIFSLFKNKYFIFSSLLWSVISITSFIFVIIFLVPFRNVLAAVFSYIHLSPVIYIFITEIIGTFLFYTSICFLFMYLIYISHFIKKHT